MFGTQAKVLADHDPSDTLARRVVVFEADAAHVASMRSSLAPDAIIEPLVYRRLHFHRLPGLLRRAVPLEARALRHTEDQFLVTITAGGQPLGGINVMVYLANSFGSVGLEMANMRVLYEEKMTGDGRWWSDSSTPASNVERGKSPRAGPPHRLPDLSVGRRRFSHRRQGSGPTPSPRERPRCGQTVRAR